MKIKDRTKYIALGTFFTVLIAFFFFIGMRVAFVYIILLLFSVYVIKFLKMEPIKGEISKSILFMCGVFFISSIVSYYFQLVWVDPDKPYVMKFASPSPVFVSLLMAPIIEELAFRRVFLGVLLKANMHWLVASCITTVLFVSMHPPYKWGIIAVISLLFSMIYARSGNLKLVIFLHFFHNLVNSIQPSFWQDLFR